MTVFEGIQERPHVVVCGTGMAGMAATLAALEAGARVSVYEKGPAPGGTTVLSGGRIWTLKKFEDLVAIAPLGNRALQRIVFERIKGDRAWLESLGVQLAPVRRIQVLGESQDCDPRVAIAHLVSVAMGRGATFHYEAGLDSLVTDEGGRVVGLRVATSGRLEEVAADAVVMATGGFQGNPDLVRRYIVPNADNLLVRANPWSTGDALLAATAIGAALTPGLENFYGHGMLDEPARYGSQDFQAASQYYGPLCPVINVDGVRFTDESAGLATRDAELIQNLAAQPGGRGYYILDSRIAELEVMPDNGVITSTVLDRVREFGGRVLEASTLDGLYELLAEEGVPSDAVRRTIEAYNQAAASGQGANLRPPRTMDHNPVIEAPFYAVPVHAAITFTMGGLSVDAGMRVLRRSASSAPNGRAREGFEELRQVPITGLFAAGSDVGNISHRGYVGGLGPALVTGRVAGETAAADARTRSAAVAT